MKQMIKIILIIILIILAVISIIAFIFIRKLNEPVVKDNYFEDVDHFEELEKKYSYIGEYEVNSIEFESNEDFFSKYKVWYPIDIETSNKKYPLVVMANGTGVPYKKYEPIFEHLASWGFIVIGNDNESSGDGKSSSLSLDFMLSLNNDSGSLFFNKIDTDAIGISGHSQGGVGAIRAVTDFENSRNFKTIYTASATTSSMIKSWNLKGWDYDVTKINIPIFMVAATGRVDSETISPLDDMKKNFELLNDDISAIMARRKNSDHGKMLENADSYMTAWFMYTLMNDIEAAKVFEGDNSEICMNNYNWQDVQVQNIK